MAFLEISQLEKHYGDTSVLKSVTFSVSRGCVLGIVGPNGIGKSTLIKILATILKPSSGGFLLDGVDGVRFSSKVSRHIGYLGEQAPLYKELSVQGFLLFMADLKGVPKAERKAQVELAMRGTDILDRRSLPIAVLSRGLQQRVALAASLLGPVQLLLFDEPSSGLDPKQSTAMCELILQQKRQNKTVLFSSHSISELELICDEFILLGGDGRIAHVDWKKKRFLSKTDGEQQPSVMIKNQDFLFNSTSYLIYLNANKVQRRKCVTEVRKKLKKNKWVSPSSVDVEDFEQGVKIVFDLSKERPPQKELDCLCAFVLTFIVAKLRLEVTKTDYEKPSLSQVFLSLGDGDFFQ